MKLANPLTAHPLGQYENINGVWMYGNPEKQGFAFSAHGYRAAKADRTIEPDKYGRMLRRTLRPLSIPTLAETREDYYARRVVQFPRYFIIEPTALCNRRCPFCTILVTNRHGMMEWRDFTKLMDECGRHDVYGLSLYQLGEPFLWKGPYEPTSHQNESGEWESDRLNISHMVDYAKRAGKFKAVNLSTNGDVKNLDVVLGSDLDDLIISIDGTTADVYNANRPSTIKDDREAFQRTVLRVKSFLAHKAARGEIKPWVRLQIINKENTRDQVIDFVKEWIDVPGVDDVLIKNLDSMRPWLGSKVVSEAEDVIKAAEIGNMPCQHIYAVGSMVADGRFNACCHDATTELTTAGANIQQMSFEEWWNGDYMRDLRARHNVGDFNLICKNCRERDTWLG